MLIDDVDSAALGSFFCTFLQQSNLSSISEDFNNLCIALLECGNELGLQRWKNFCVWGKKKKMSDEDGIELDVYIRTQIVMNACSGLDAIIVTHRTA
mgnify:FL=1